jgi:hypothetical protein
LLQRGGVGVGHGDITGLHGHELLVGLEVIIGGEDSCTYQLFLKDGNKVEQVLGMVIADIVDFV